MYVVNSSFFTQSIIWITEIAWVTLTLTLTLTAIQNTLIKHTPIKYSNRTITWMVWLIDAWIIDPSRNFSTVEVLL